MTKIQWWRTRRALIFGTLLACAIAFSLTRFIVGEQERHLQQRINVQFVADTWGAEIERQLRTSVSSTITLAAVLSTDTCGLTGGNFDIVAASLITTLRGITNLQLAPGGVISQIYPLVGHESALGLSLLSHPIQREGALRAIDRQRETFVGPIRLVQGDVGVIARHPVFTVSAANLTVPVSTTIDGWTYAVNCAVERCSFQGPVDPAGSQTHFWGFATMLTLVADLVAAVGLRNLEVAGYEYQLATNSSLDDDHVTFATSAGAVPPTDFADSVVASVDYPEADVHWTLRVRPTTGWALALHQFDFWLQLALLTLFTLQSIYTFYKAQVGRATSLTLKRTLQEERERKRIYERSVNETFHHVKESLGTQAATADPDPSFASTLSASSASRDLAALEMAAAAAAVPEPEGL